MIDTALTLIKMILSKNKEIQKHKQDSICISYAMERMPVGRPDSAVLHPVLVLTIETREYFVIDQIEVSGCELAEIRRVEGETVGGMGVILPSILEPEESDWSSFLRVHVCPDLCAAHGPTKVRYLIRAIPGPDIPHKVTVTVRTAAYPQPFTCKGVIRS